MSEATIIDGKATAAGLRAWIGEQIEQLSVKNGVKPGLAVVLVGEDPASQVYVRSKRKTAIQLGMNSFEHTLPADTDQATVLALVQQLNRDPKVHGILVQLPLPAHLDDKPVILAIDPLKVVDGLHPENAGRHVTGGRRYGIAEPVRHPDTPPDSRTRAAAVPLREPELLRVRVDAQFSGAPLPVGSN